MMAQRPGRSFSRTDAGWLAHVVGNAHHQAIDSSTTTLNWLRTSVGRDLVARATPLHERWRGGMAPRPADVRLIEARLQAWRHALSVEGDPELLERRLGFEGLNEESVRGWLGEARLQEETPMPAWVERL